MPCLRCQRTLPSESAFCPHCGQTVGAAVEADELLGAFIAGRYRITSVIGEGGMGRVYLADQTMGAATRRVAIKVLLPQFAADAKAASRFLRECATTGALDDPHTVRVYDCGQLPDGRLYIAMEYVDGRSLAALLEEDGPLAPARVVELLGQLCESLEEAHGKRIVHRDLKPENIMIVARPGGGELVKVLDFGIAKAIDDPGHAAGPVITSAGAIVGSPPYMSPEQFVAEELDARADVYALGVIGYEMLTGTRPFEARSVLEWGTKHLTAAPAPFDATDAGRAVPEAMRRAVLHALAKNREERPASARAFYAELASDDAENRVVVVPRLAAVGGAAQRAGVATTVDEARMVPTAQPRRTWLLLAAGASAATLALVGAFLLGRQPSSAEHGADDDSHAPPREACVRARAAALGGKCDEARRALASGCTGGPGHMEAQHEFEDHCER
jgi:hypothetical protein